MNQEVTTLVCLYHSQDHARAAIRDLVAGGIPQGAISTVDKSDAQTASMAIEELGVPERDHQHLLEGINAGGVLIAVAAITENISKAEAVFEGRAGKIDEAVVRPNAAPTAVPAMAVAGETVIPVVEEELVVGKREVERGGVRVYRRIVETPIEESVNLRQEHITVDRVPVNRAVSGDELTMQGDRTIELTETAEEAVVGKTARVVEEVRLGKETSEHAAQIHDTVRRTEVEVEQAAAGANLNRAATTATTAENSERDITRGGL